MFSGIYFFMDKDIDKIWKEYWDKRNDKILLKLMNYYVHLVETITYTVLSDHPTASSSFDDLFTAGLFALKDAIDSYPPDCQTSFENNFTATIRQSMLDQLNHPSVPLTDYILKNW